MFRTQFTPRVRVESNVGSRIHTLFQGRVDANGSLELVESGYEDIYEQIQSHKDSCDIHLILQRYANGDVAALSKAQGVYGDFTEIPKTYADLLNAVISGEHYFNSLPVETRAQFDHSFYKFMASMDKPGFLETLGLVPAPSVDSQSAPSPTVAETTPAPQADHEEE